MENTFKFSIGDFIIVGDDDFQYPNYTSYFKEHDIEDLAETFVDGQDVPEFTIGKVVHMAKHRSKDCNLYAVEIFKNIYIVAEDGLYGAMEEIDPYEFAYRNDKLNREVTEHMNKLLSGDINYATLEKILDELGYTEDDIEYCEFENETEFVDFMNERFGEGNWEDEIKYEDDEDDEED